MLSTETVNVRSMVDDVAAAIDFYTVHFGFTVGTSALPAFADVTRGNLRLLLSGPNSSAGRPMAGATLITRSFPDGVPQPVAVGEYRRP